MSQSSISRWQSIPMERATNDDSMKRSRPDKEESDDDVSLVSRSPSPEPEGMDVDPDTYREHVRGPPREVITVDTRIKPENKGFALLARMGWSEGQPLGLSGDGRVDPIPFQLKNDSTGIGKTTQDIRMIETTVSQRKGLEAERQQKETEAQRKAREELVARKVAVENEISTVLRAFYCELCDKQFKNVAQYDEHTNSYGHHHKARLQDMNANARPTSQGDVDKRKEKERRREEKELRKMAAAAGVKMPKAAVHSSGASVLAPISDTVPRLQSETAPESIQLKNSGWATVNATGPQPGGFKKSGWATVGSMPQASASGFSQTTPIPSPSAQSTSGPHLASNSHTSPAPAFRNAGWTSLDTGSSQQLSSRPAPHPQPPCPAPVSHQTMPTQPLLAPETTTAPARAPSPAAPAPQPSGGGWKQFQNSMRGKSRR